MEKLITLVCLLGLFSTSALAEHDGVPHWTGEGELGFTAASGNSDTKNLNASLGVSREADDWTHTATLDLIKAEANDEDSADSKVFRTRSEYAFSERSYLFGGVRYSDDKFSGYDFQASITAGVGHTFVDSEHHRFEAAAGLGFRRERDETTREDDDDTIGSLEGLYEYRISDNATLTERLLVEAGTDNTFTESETSLLNRINGNLLLKLTYLFKRNSEVPPDTDKTDEIVTVSLVYGF